eukprot:CAMPEP_0119044912 /NCGR_PEP_ID=MMETSP1177-20130426/35647_1 /TAXON_ID=2985 /ORGANISM="Ochromonas sp, Strain CCMP1899" /LENGTH=31 /DNA_ID= /DNA_START= /DNA_END= /DNA_ORIENTATION=
MDKLPVDEDSCQYVQEENFEGKVHRIQYEDN